MVRAMMDLELIARRRRAANALRSGAEA